jgi:hypothetical protein
MVANSTKNRLHIRIETVAENPTDIAGASSIDIALWEPMVLLHH